MIRQTLMIFGLTAALAPRARAQGAEEYTFRMLLGRDTLTSEVVQRTLTRVDVDLMDRSTGAHWRYSMSLAPDGGVSAVHNAFYRMAQGDTVPFQTATLTFDRDSVRVVIGGNVSRTQVIATRPGALPYINPCSP